MMITFTQGTKVESKNKRLKPRWDSQGHCMYRTNNDRNSHKGQVKDISCSGACITTNQDFAINQKIHLTIHMPDNNVVRVSGTAVWKRVNDIENMIGIQFFILYLLCLYTPYH